MSEPDFDAAHAHAEALLDPADTDAGYDGKATTNLARAYLALRLVPTGAARDGPLVALAAEVNEINRANGWDVLTPDDWPDVRKVITLLALVTTEVAEAIEAVREDDRTNFAEEMADTVIRCLDICGGLGIDLDAEVRANLAKNRTRGYRHGGKGV